jgi:hypothetical protein
VEVRTYIQDLFNYLDRYENATAQFETEAFLQTYNGIIAVLNPLRQQRQEAVAVDEYLLERIMQSPLTSSDLRQLAVQILITFFESEADTDGQTNRAYAYCRGLRAVKQDIPYFEKHLVPLVCDEGSLNNNFRLKQFMLSEIARYLVKFGRPVQAGLRPEDFLALSSPLQLVELVRRRSELGPNLRAAPDRMGLFAGNHVVDQGEGRGRFVDLGHRPGVRQFGLFSPGYQPAQSGLPVLRSDDRILYLYCHLRADVVEQLR